MTPTVLVTGATDGLGQALAGRLADQGATVLIHGRDADRLEETARNVGAARAYRADFAALAEVHALADELLGDEARIDVLVNNAGVGSTLPGDGERQESRDGHELRFAVNYLAPFVLTERVIALLERSAGDRAARIVNVASAGQMAIDFDDVMLEDAYDGTRAYCQSKLAQVMHTFDLAEALDPAVVTATCLHPATFMPTKMVIHARGSGVSPLAEGVAATERLAVGDDVAGMTGRYFNGQREARADAQAYDAAARQRLRALSLELGGLSG
jgi:NAD(P)-dependent dehydrogenase (short-subunit alcohol dehydrogenase family)